MTDVDLEPLSVRAKALAGVWFGLMDVERNSGVTLHLSVLKPTAQTQAALDELLAAGVISVEPFNRYGGVVYRPLVNCRPAWKWLGENIDNPVMKDNIMEPV